MSSSDDGYGSMQELQNVGVVPNYKRTTALRSELAHAPKQFFLLSVTTPKHSFHLEAIERPVINPRRASAERVTVLGP